MHHKLAAVVDYWHIQQFIHSAYWAQHSSRNWIFLFWTSGKCLAAVRIASQSSVAESNDSQTFFPWMTLVPGSLGPLDYSFHECSLTTEMLLYKFEASGADYQEKCPLIIQRANVTAPISIWGFYM
jgi:hypothetical protein